MRLNYLDFPLYLPFTHLHMVPFKAILDKTIPDKMISDKFEKLIYFEIYYDYLAGEARSVYLHFGPKLANCDIA